MSTSLLYHAFGVRDYRHLATRYEGGAVVFEVEPRRIECPQCQGVRAIIGRGFRWRRLQGLPVGRRQTFLDVKIPRIECRRCDLVSEIDPAWADPFRRQTHRLEQYIADLCRITTIKGAAEFAGVSWDVAKDIEKRRLHRLYSKPSLGGVRYLAMDEIAVKKGHRYMTVVADIETGRVLYVGDGKDADALKPFLVRLKRARAKLKAVAMDMSAAYVKAVREAFPGLPVVFDRFHVVKLVNEQLDQLRRDLCRDTEKVQRKFMKGVRYLILMRSDKLDELDKTHPGAKNRLNRALTLNEPLNKAYYFKEKLCSLWDQPDRGSAAEIFRECIAEAHDSAVGHLRKLANTLVKYQEGILAFFDHNRMSNGLLEGINNKIKTMKRMAYGYRDAEFFKLKILGLHEARYKLVG